MPKSTATCNKFLQLIFNAVAWANIADNAAASPLTNLYLALHTADPGVGNAQTTNEISSVSYVGYVRIAVARTAGGWTVSTNTAVNAALAQFAQCGGAGDTATWVSIGTASSGAGNVLYSGEMNDPLAIALNIQPQFAAGALTVTET
jgi:hypothetical protein